MSFLPGAVPKTDLGLENGLKNQMNFLFVKLLNSACTFTLGPWQKWSCRASVVGWCHICFSAVLACYGHVCSVWRHTSLGIVLMGALQPPYPFWYLCAQRGAAIAAPVPVSDWLQKGCSWKNPCFCSSWLFADVVSSLCFWWCLSWRLHKLAWPCDCWRLSVFPWDRELPLL